MSTERRIHVPSIPEVTGTVVLDDAASRHLAVLRLVVGDEVTLFDGKGARAIAVVDSVDRAHGSFTVRVARSIVEAARRAPDLIFGSWCGKKFNPRAVAARPSTCSGDM